MQNSVIASPKAVEKQVDMGCSCSASAIKGVHMRTWLLGLFVLSMSSMLSAAAPVITSVYFNDLDGNGKIDEVAINFDISVNITDGDPNNGFSPLQIGSFVIANGDYSTTAPTTFLNLPLVEGSQPNTGEVADVIYSATTSLGSITDDITGDEIVDGTISQSAFNYAAPVLMAAITNDGASGEVFLQFSEPVQRASGNILSVSNFAYNDTSVGGASSVSAMGADADGGDGWVRVLLNSPITLSDNNMDTISVVGLMEIGGSSQSVLSTPATIIIDPSFVPPMPGAGPFSFTGVDVEFAVFNGNDFNFFVDVKTNGDVVSVVMTAPDGTNYTMGLDESMGTMKSFFFGTPAQSFGTSSQLFGNFAPTGDYLFTATDSNGNSGNVVLTLSYSPVLPTAPTIDALVSGDILTGTPSFTFSGTDASAETLELIFIDPITDDEISYFPVVGTSGFTIASDVPVAGGNYNVELLEARNSVNGTVSSSFGDSLPFMIVETSSSVVPNVTVDAPAGPSGLVVNSVNAEYMMVNGSDFGFFLEVMTGPNVAMVELEAPDSSIYNLMMVEDMVTMKRFEFGTQMGVFPTSSDLMGSFPSTGSYVITVKDAQGASVNVTATFNFAPAFPPAPQFTSLFPGDTITGTPSFSFAGTDPSAEMLEIIFIDATPGSFNEFSFFPALGSSTFDVFSPISGGGYDVEIMERRGTQNFSITVPNGVVPVSVSESSSSLVSGIIVDAPVVDPNAPTGAIEVLTDNNFFPDALIPDGSQNVHTLSAFFTTDAGTVNVSEIVVDIEADVADVTTDVTAARLVVTDGFGTSAVVKNYTGVMSADNVAFSMSDLAVSGGNQLLVELFVDMAQFPAPGPLAFKLDGAKVKTDKGPGFSEFPVFFGFEVGSGSSGLSGSFVRSARYEIYPEVHDMSSSTNVSALFAFGAGPNDAGFDAVDVMLPPSFSNAVFQSISVASSANATSAEFVALATSDYTTSFDSDFGVLAVTFAATQTAASGNAFYRINFSADTLDEQVAFDRFNLFLRNETLGQDFFAEANRDVNVPLANHPTDPAGVQIRFAGTVSDSRNVASFQAEIDTTPISLFDNIETPGIDANATGVGMALYGKVEVLTGELGFDIIAVEFPDVMSVTNAGTMTVEFFDPATEAYIPETGWAAVATSGRLKLTGTAPKGVGVHMFKLGLEMSTGAIFDFVNFNVAVNNTTNPVAPMMAFADNAEPMSVNFPNYVETGKWNGLGVPVKINENLPEGSSLAYLSAEAETLDGYASTGADVDVTLNVYALQSDGVINGNGFDMLEVELPMGFSLKGTVSASTNGLGKLSATEATITTTEADPATGTPGLSRIKFSSVQGTGNVFVYATLTAPFDEVESFFSVRAINTQFLHSDVYAVSSDVDGDTKGGELSLRVVAQQSTTPNLTGFNYEVEVNSTGEVKGFDSGFADADTAPIWRLHLAPQITAGVDQGFNVVRVNLPSELAEDLPTGIKVFTASATDIVDPTLWTSLSSGVDYDVVNLDSYGFGVKFRAVQSTVDLRYVVAFSKKVTPYPSFMFVDPVINNTSNFNPVFGVVGEADGFLVDNGDREDGGFAVEGAFSAETNATSIAAIIETPGAIFTGNVANFSLFVKIDITAGIDKGVDTFKLFYPHDLDGLRLVNAASATLTEVNSVVTSSTNLEDKVKAALSGNGIASSLYKTSSLNPGEFEMDFTKTLTESEILRLDFQANTPTYPLFAYFDLEVNNSLNYAPAFVTPDDVLEDGTDLILGFEVKPNFTRESLKEIAESATVEVLVAPQADASGTVQPFVTPKSLPQFSVVMMAKMNANVAGFNVITMLAPSGFSMPKTYSVYKSANIQGLSDVTNLLQSSVLTVNTNEIDNGLIKLEFQSVQDAAAMSSTQGYTDSTAFYRIDFTPTAPDFESFGELDVSLTNKSNPVEFFPTWGNVAAATDVGMDATTALDYDAMYVDVFVPYNANALPVVDYLEAEVNVGANGRRVIDMNTEGVFNVSIRLVISDNTVVAGFDRIDVDVPFGFTAPSAVTMAKYVGGVFSSNVRVESEFKSDISRLIIRLKSVEKEQEEHYYAISFKSKSFDYPAPAFFSVGVDNSSAPNLAFAFGADVDGVFNNDGLEIDVLQKAVDLADFADEAAIDAHFNNLFTPVADDLILEVSPQTATISGLSQNFVAYVKAENIEGQRGFNRLVLELPWDFSNVGSVEIFKSSSASSTGFEGMLVGLGLSEVKALSDDPTYGNSIRVDFSSVMGSGNTETIKVEFKADMPDYATVGEIFAVVDDKSQSLPSFARPGNASSYGSTDDTLVFVEPDFSSIDFATVAQPLSGFVAEVVSGNAVASDDTLFGAVETSKLSVVDIYIEATKNAGDNGFDFLEVYVPFPIDGNKLTTSDIQLATIKDSVTPAVNPSDFVRIDPTKLKINKTDFSVSIKIDKALSANLLSDGIPSRFRVRMPVVAPDFSGLYEFGLRVFSTSQAGFDSYPFPGNAIDSVLDDSMAVNVRPFISADLDLTKFPVSFVEAESAPNFAPAGTTTRFSVMSQITVSDLDGGYNQFKVDLPPGFGKPSAVSLSVSELSSRQLDPSKYSVQATEEALLVTLLDDTLTSASNTIHYTTLSFDSVTPSVPDFGYFDLLVSDKSNPFLAVPAAWFDVNTSSGNGDGSMMIDVYPDFTAIASFDPPVNNLLGEVDIKTTEGGSTVLSSSTANVSLFMRAEIDAATAKGIDLIKVFMDPAFGSFPTAVDVAVRYASTPSSTNILVAGTSTGFTLDTSNPAVAVIKLKQAIKENADIDISFNIQTPEDAGLFFIDFAVDNSAVPFDFFPGFGFVDLDGDDLDGNDLFVEIHPQPIVFDANVYTVDSVVAEIDTLSGNALKVNAGGKLELAVSVMNTSGNGFDRLGLRKPDFLTFSNVNSVSYKMNDGASVVSGNLVKDRDFTLAIEDEIVRVNFASVQLATAGTMEIFFNVSVNAPDFPTEVRFDVFVNNSKLRQPIYAIGGDVDPNIANDDLSIDIAPDFSSLDLTQPIADSLQGISSEAVFSMAAGESKKAETNSSNVMRVYVQTQFAAADRGINKFTIVLPPSFGKPSNVAVFSSNATGRTELVKGNVDYKSTIGTDNSVSVDFSGAQRDTFKLIDFTDSFDGSGNVDFQIEFTSQLPETPGLYFLDVEAINKSVPLPIFAQFGNLNGNDDDDGDGFADGINDNNTALFVTPKQISSEAFAAISNAESVHSELMNIANGELGKTVSLSVATKVIVGAAGNIDRLFMRLPSEFSNVNGLVLDKTVLSTGSNVRLAEITDYTQDVSDVTNMKVLLKTGIVEDVVIKATFNVTLPSRSDEFLLAAAVDNSATPKIVESVPGDAITGSGFDGLSFFVDPVAFTAADLEKTMMSGFTASISSPATVEVNKSTTVSMQLTASFSPADQGFDLLEVFSQGISGFKDVKISTTLEGGVATTLFLGQDYKVFETSIGGSVAFTTAISSNTTIDLSFTATAGTDPIVADYEVVAASTKLPVTVPALIPTAGTLGITVTPAQKTAAELKQRPAKPVAGLLYDVTPGFGVAGNILDIDVFAQATMAANSTLNFTDAAGVARTEEVPASSGFDLIKLNLPRSYGAVSKLTFFHTNASGNEIELQPVTDYTFTVNKNNVVNISLLTPLATPGVAAIVDFRLRVSVALPNQPKTTNIRLRVDNSRNPQAVKAAKSDLSADGLANRKVIVEPAPVAVGATTQSVAAAAIATIRYNRASGNNVTGDVSEKGYAYNLRLKLNSTPDTIGFTDLNITLPEKFRKASVTGVKVLNSAGNLVSVAKGSKGYTAILDKQTNNLDLSFSEAQGVESTGTTFGYMDIGLAVKTPPVEGSYIHQLKMTNGVSSMDVAPGYVEFVVGVATNSDSAQGETGQLAVDVITQSTAAKGGFFGDLNVGIVDSLGATITAWDEANGSYSANITQSANVRNILLQTKPVIATATQAGFDYMQIDLPFGAGTPSNIVVFLRSAGGNIVYLQDFVDFTTSVTTSDITIEFNSAVNKSFLDTIFTTKLTEALVAEELLVSFDMTMPNVLGQHLFDAFVLDTASKSAPYYVDSLLGEVRATNLVTVERGRDSVGNVIDGTRFLRIDQAPSTTATASVDDAIAELVAIGKATFLPKNAKRQLRLDVAVTASAGQTYDYLEVQLPEGFKSVTNVIVSQGLNRLTEYVDYNLDLSHNRSFVISLKAKASVSNAYSIIFDVVTPRTLPTQGGVETSATYAFGVVVNDTESGLLTKTPVYARTGNASAFNSGESLSLVVTNGSAISGSIVLKELPLGDVEGSISLESASAGTIYKKDISFAKGVGSTGFDYGLSSLLDATPGIDVGDYNLVITVPGYDVKTTSVSIATSATSIEGLFVELDAVPVQAALLLEPRFFAAGSTTPVSFHLDLNTSAGNSVSAFEFTLPGSSVSAFSVTSISAGNVELSPSSVTVAGSPIKVSVSGLTATTNVVINGSLTTLAGVNDSSAVTSVVTTSVGDVVAMSEVDYAQLPKATVGTFVSIRTESLVPGVIGDAYLSPVRADYDINSIDPKTLNFSVNFTDANGAAVLADQLGLAMDSAGALGGTPALIEGSPYQVNLTLTGTSSDGSSYTATATLPLSISRDKFSFYVASPSVIPETGGEVVVTGAGFTNAAVVSVDGSPMTTVTVDSGTLRVTVPAKATGSYAIKVDDSGDTATPASGQSLMVAPVSEGSQVFDDIIEGDADLSDYELVGLTHFYQGDIRAALESAFGAYDVTKWRAYYYDSVSKGHKQLTDLTDTTAFTAIRPGTAFWRIAREVGTVKTSGVAADQAEAYYVTIPAATWSLVTNVYGSSVEWGSGVSYSYVQNDQLTTGTMTETAAANVVNGPYAFSKELAKTESSSPYEQTTVLESGKGYWVQNKALKPLTIKIMKPSSSPVLVKSRAKASSEAVVRTFKAGNDLPPSPPETFEKASSAGTVGGAAAAGGGGGGCLLK